MTLQTISDAQKFYDERDTVICVHVLRLRRMVLSKITSMTELKREEFEFCDKLAGEIVSLIEVLQMKPEFKIPRHQPECTSIENSDTTSKTVVCESIPATEVKPQLQIVNNDEQRRRRKPCVIV